MASIIEGYNYDIFISYRQKDNKGDKWVSEFVEALKTELESTFKEEVSVYFDINPHDGLLETQDVDASLREKLKCLVLIPIISRTFCDPRSFAWEHEFKAFVEQASKDQYGLRVTLPNGNVASRVLPVQIHDLDPGDIKQCESVIGGYLRGIEFIYKEPGVNRPLRSNEENPHDNLNRTIYRNQINKVALALKDIIESIKNPPSGKKVQESDARVEQSKKKKEILIEEPVRKEVPPSSKEKITKAIPERDKEFSLPLKPGIVIPAILVIVIYVGAFIFFLNRDSGKKWAQTKALSEIEQLINKGDMRAAFNMVRKAEKYLPENPKLHELSSLTTSDMTILTDPPGADVYLKEYSGTDDEWEKVGKTPIKNLRIPGSSYWQSSSLYLAKMNKQGYEEILAVISTTDDTISRKLFRNGTIPEGMVYVEGENGFFIDRFEVTNKEFKEFIDNGGYTNPEFWKNEFVINGTVIGRDKAAAMFVDKTGRPGPSTWEAGDYPEGQENYPVSGISWYEADAYAVYAGKSLPTADDWITATGGVFYLGSRIIPISNFSGNGPEPVGNQKGMSIFGTYDMAGNVREWCWNETPEGRVIRGGAWNDASYLYGEISQVPALDRSPRNGFRCVKYIDREKMPEISFGPIEYIESKDYSEKVPVTDDIFQVYRNQFLYDKTELKVSFEGLERSDEDWTVEKVRFNSANGKERIIVFLFKPVNASPPFQTLLLWPGLNALSETDIFRSEEVKWITDFVLKSGRAVLIPIYAGTFDRINEQEQNIGQGHKYTEWMIKWVKEFKRSVDYLETRPDIDKNRLGYYGYSWGGYMGGIVPAVEERISLNILIVGGFYGEVLPEADAVNYVSRVKIPTLMLNGKYDFRFPLENNVKPFFRLLGTPDADKVLHIYDTDHYVPKNEMIKEILGWLDRYFGPVRPLSGK